MSELNTKISFPSDPQNVSRVQPFVDGLASELKLPEDVHGNILISVTEAVTNAIVHGNCADQSKQVFISSRCRENALSIRVMDEGTGFDPEFVPDPTRPEFIERCGGRGLFLMRHLSDRCSFLRGGSMVEMRFKI
jgi:serine/threonine-protein kinase RsbW